MSDSQKGSVTPKGSGLPIPSVFSYEIVEGKSHILLESPALVHNRYSQLLSEGC